MMSPSRPGVFPNLSGYPTMFRWLVRFSKKAQLETAVNRGRANRLPHSFTQLGVGSFGQPSDGAQVVRYSGVGNILVPFGRGQIPTHQLTSDANQIVGIQRPLNCAHLPLPGGEVDTFNSAGVQAGGTEVDAEGRQSVARQGRTNRPAAVGFPQTDPSVPSTPSEVRTMTGRGRGHSLLAYDD